MLDLFNFFDSLFKKYSFSQVEIQKLARKFTGIYMGNLIINAKLSEPQQHEVNKLSEDSKWDEVLNLIRYTFPNEQGWTQYSEKVFVALIDEYFKQVTSFYESN